MGYPSLRIDSVGPVYTETTIERVNGTGVLEAVIDPDDPTHVLVRPVDSSQMGPWMDSRPVSTTHPHPLTEVLQGVCERCRK